MATIDERITALEDSVNLLLQEVQTKATVDDAETYSDTYDPAMEALVKRVKRLEEVLQTIRYQKEIIEKT